MVAAKCGSGLVVVVGIILAVELPGAVVMTVVEVSMT